MSVYVDSAENSFGRMTMCHMFADTTEELIAMAVAIGVKRRWLQYAGTHKEHFDICKSKRALAVKQGAKEVPSRFMVELSWKKRANMQPSLDSKREDR